MAFDAGSTATGVGEGAAAGAAFGPVGAVVGGVIGGLAGGVFGGKAKKAKKTAQRLMRESAAVERLKARRATIISVMTQSADATVAGYAAGYNPEGTSSLIGVQQSINAQGQSSLKTESKLYQNSLNIEKALRQAQRAQSNMDMVMGGLKAAGSIKSMASGWSKTPSEISTSNLPMKYIDTSTFPQRR